MKVYWKIVLYHNVVQDLFSCFGCSDCFERCTRLTDEMLTGFLFGDKHEQMGQSPIWEFMEGETTDLSW